MEENELCSNNLKTNQRYILNTVMFEHYYANFQFQRDYCFGTILFKEYGYDFEKQLKEMEKLIHSFPFSFIGSREFCLIKAGGWHFHFITQKQNLPLIAELCDYHIPKPRWDDSFEKALTYVTKEDVNECTANDFSRSSKTYYQKNDPNFGLFKVIHGYDRVELIGVKQIIELKSLTATLEQSTTTLKCGSGSTNWVNYIRLFKGFFSQLFIKKKTVFIDGVQSYSFSPNARDGPT
jgi:hypothetical protein